MKATAHNQGHLDELFLYALQALPSREFAVIEKQIASCIDCQHEIERLRPVVRSFVGWPTDILRPAESLWLRIAERVANDSSTKPFVAPVQPTEAAKSDWAEPAPGIHVKILASDDRNNG